MMKKIQDCKCAASTHHTCHGIYYTRRLTGVCIPSVANIVKVHAPIILFFVLDSAPIVAHSCADSLLCGPSQPGSSKGNKTTNIFHYSCQ